MCSRAVNKINAEKRYDEMEKRTPGDIVHDTREMFRVSERLQWTEQRRLDHPVTAVLHHQCSQCYSPAFISVGVKDRALLLVLTPSSCGIYTRFVRVGFDVPRIQGVMWNLVMHDFSWHTGMSRAVGCLLELRLL